MKPNSRLILTIKSEEHVFPTSLIWDASSLQHIDSSLDINSGVLLRGPKDSGSLIFVCSSWSKGARAPLTAVRMPVCSLQQHDGPL